MVRRAKGEIGKLMVSIARVHDKCPLGTMQELKEPSVLCARML